jgi:hypothetical protein
MQKSAEFNRAFVKNAIVDAVTDRPCAIKTNDSE